MAETANVQPGENTGSRRTTVLLISAAVAFYWSSMYFYVPTLPIYAQDRIGDLAKVGVVLSMYGLWQALVRLPLGILADWVGRRKPFIFIGFALSALGAYTMATASGFGGLVVGRAITGLAAASWVPLTVLFSSQFPPEEAVRATALVTLINGISRMVATSTNGTLNNFGGYSLAFFIAMGVAALAILTLLPVREGIRQTRRPALTAIGRLVTRRDVLVPSLLNALGECITWTTTFGFLPILARNLGASGEMQSLLITINLGISLAGNLVTSTIARRWGSLRLLYTGYLVLAGGISVAATARALPAVFLAQVLLGLGSGIVYPLCMGLSIKKVDDTQRGTAMGLHQSVYGIGMFAGPWLSGILANAVGIQPMFWVMGGTCLAVSAALARVLGRK